MNYDLEQNKLGYQEPDTAGDNSLLPADERAQRNGCHPLWDAVFDSNESELPHSCTEHLR